MPILFFVVAACVIMLLVSGTYVFIVACARGKDIPWLIKEEVDKTSFAKYYPQILEADQWLSDHNSQCVCIESSDGLRLYGRWIPADNAKGTVICAHGYRSTVLVDFGQAFDYYHSMGLNILAPDQRSHGMSQGKCITFGVKESCDIQDWIRFHNSEFGNYPIVLTGLSMGASTVLFLADRILPENVKGIIADCGFTSPAEIIRSVFCRVIHLPAVPTIWVTELLARLLASFSLYRCDTRKSLSGSRLPVLLIHGLDDNFVPWEMSQQGYDACVSEKHLLLVDGAEHGVSFLIDRDGYTKTVNAFIRKYILVE